VQTNERNKSDHRKERPPPSLTPFLLLALLCVLGWEFPYLSSCQEVHHCLVAFLHGKQLRNLYISASAHIACSGGNDAPAAVLRCLCTMSIVILSVSKLL
jgi:hypothetical protein